MRVDLTTFGTEPADSSKPGRVGQAAGAPTAAGSASANNSESASSSVTSSLTSSASGASGLDQSRFSFDLARVQSLAARVLAQPEVRGTQVQALRQTIEKGKYSVSPGQIADALAGALAG
jgi:flagellar biosynthesis anti-sigma factor FlgM